MVKKTIMAIYSFGKMENVDQVFPKNSVNKDLLKDLIKMFLTETLEEHIKKDDNKI